MKGGIQKVDCVGTVPDAFPGGWGRIPDNPLIAAAAAALFKAPSGGWMPDRDGRLTYRHITEGGDRIVVFLDPAAVLASEGDCGLRGQCSFVEGMSALTLDVLFALLAQIGASSGAQPFAPSMPLTASAVLRYKGLRRWGAEGAALRRRIGRELVRLEGLRFEDRGEAARRQAPNSQLADDVKVDGVPLFEILDSAVLPVARRRRAAGVETVWLVRLGPWWKPEPRPDGRVPLTDLPRHALRFDHRRNRGCAVLAKKISLAAAALWEEAPSRVLRIESVLADIGELPAREARRGKWGARMRARFDRAIAMLETVGVSGRIEPAEDNLPRRAGGRKQRAEDWLAGNFVFHRPQVPRGDTSRSEPPGAVRAAATTPLELRRGAAIRATRLEHGLSQAALARKLGVSASYLSQVENDRRLASRGMLGRFAGWQGANAGVDRRPSPPKGKPTAAEFDYQRQEFAAPRSPQIRTTALQAEKDGRT